YKGTVYRGTKLDEASLITIMGMKPGDSVYMKSFTSTSLLESKASEFNSDVLFEIESLTGRNISHISDYPTEKEVLLSPDTRYKVESIEFEQKSIRVRLKELLPEEMKTRLSVNLKKNKKMDPNEVRKFLLSNPKLTQKQRERIMRLNPDQLIKIILAIFSKKGKEEPNKFTEIFI
ncbi:MAG: ADP-ribosyltransferase domain-containing protein, partial [Paludibacteraceae bacterium]|nr:ADP-ribosyltransferase domain-containing protein [Paludibacteraceae bacterium]